MMLLKYASKRWRCKLKYNKTFLTGYDLYVYNGSSYTYTFQYYKQSLDDIVKSLKVSLNMVKKKK